MQNVGLIKNTLIKNTHALIDSINYYSSVIDILLCVMVSGRFCQAYMLYAHTCLNCILCVLSCNLQLAMTR